MTKKPLASNGQPTLPFPKSLINVRVDEPIPSPEFHPESFAATAVSGCPLMCRSKRSTDVVRPDTPKSSKSMFSLHTATSSSGANLSQPPSSSSNFFTPTTAIPCSSFSYSSSLPLTPTSLASLKPHLPENPHIYPFHEISSATGNFLQECLSHSSWQSTLRGKRVAIFRRKLRRPIRSSLLAEKLSLICRSHHSSIVKLSGVTVQGQYIYLVYDFIQGLNLEDCLRNKMNPHYTILSSWMSRMRIASDVAHGLEYMHYCAGIGGSGFVHNHVKSSSIIITEGRKNMKSPSRFDGSNTPTRSSYVAKIRHFATAELCGEAVEEEESCLSPKSSGSLDTKLKRSNSREKKFEGTRGYMSPEFRTTGFGTRKSDVYAFGVVMLELLCGEEPLKYIFNGKTGEILRISIIEKAREAILGGGVRTWMDKRLSDSYPVEVAEKMVKLGLECVEDNPNRRPEMGRIAGRISKFYLESQSWDEKFASPQGFSSSMAPR
ncbi:hypothetical protein MLD38_024213 [Melastoma candidum]|uniref:Uncharacterized protein n=1 Tax=Melastoma candidum TaxID=119954 RepID=A0ACB9NRM5_9MYRT|nr:hypothetical protein MLD38_024213 [Melastoma candidum]